MAEFNPLVVRPELTVASTLNNHAPATNTDAVVTYPIVSGYSHAITEGIAWSYSGTGTLSGGNLLIETDGLTVFTMDITSKGNGFVPWRYAAPMSKDLEITLAAGGSNVDGKLNILGYTRVYGSAIGASGIFDFDDYAQSGLIAVL